MAAQPLSSLPLLSEGVKGLVEGAMELVAGGSSSGGGGEGGKPGAGEHGLLQRQRQLAPVGVMA